MMKEKEKDKKEKARSLEVKSIDFKNKKIKNEEVLKKIKQIIIVFFFFSFISRKELCEVIQVKKRENVKCFFGYYDKSMVF